METPASFNIPLNSLHRVLEAEPDRHLQRGETNTHLFQFPPVVLAEVCILRKIRLRKGRRCLQESF